MRVFLAVFLMLLAGIGLAAPNAPSAATALKGEVLEVKDVDAYTYLRLKTKDGEIWAAVNKAPVTKGAEVTIENPAVMTNFTSKTLNKTFDRSYSAVSAAPPRMRRPRVRRPRRPT